MAFRTGELAMTIRILAITECTRVAIVVDGTVAGSDAGEILTYGDEALRYELRGFGDGKIDIYQMPEWVGMTDAEIFHLPRSVEALLEHGAELRRTIVREAP